MILVVRANVKKSVLKQKDRDDLEPYLQDNSNASKTITVTEDYTYLPFIYMNAIL